jgi:cytidylate kinase
MKAITISREYGGGGIDVGRHLADTLGWQYFDKELVHETAALAETSEPDLERIDEHAVSIADRFRLHPPHEAYVKALRQVITEHAGNGQAILVGRGAHVILRNEPDCLHVRLIAPLAWRSERVSQRDDLTADQATARCREVDRERAKFTKYLFSEDLAQPSAYHLVVNVGRFGMGETVELLSGFALRQAAAHEPRRDVKRVVTMARQLGAGDTGFAPTLAERLGLAVWDREILHRDAEILHVPEVTLDGIDESGPSIFDRFQSGSLHERYLEALQQVMRELSRAGNVLVLGRGGCMFLKDHPHALHVRLVAPMAVRVRRAMEYRWLAEGPARTAIAQSDAQRKSFFQAYFGVDWEDPLLYDVTVNSGRLGAAAVDLVAAAAETKWAMTR